MVTRNIVITKVNLKKCKQSLHSSSQILSLFSIFFCFFFFVTPNSIQDLMKMKSPLYLEQLIFRFFFLCIYLETVEYSDISFYHGLILPQRRWGLRVQTHMRCYSLKKRLKFNSLLSSLNYIFFHSTSFNSSPFFSFCYQLENSKIIKLSVR